MLEVARAVAVYVCAAPSLIHHCWSIITSAEAAVCSGKLNITPGAVITVVVTVPENPPAPITNRCPEVPVYVCVTVVEPNCGLLEDAVHPTAVHAANEGEAHAIITNNSSTLLNRIAKTPRSLP